MVDLFKSYNTSANNKYSVASHHESFLVKRVGEPMHLNISASVDIVILEVDLSARSDFFFAI